MCGHVCVGRRWGWYTTHYNIPRHRPHAADQAPHALSQTCPLALPSACAWAVPTTKCTGPEALTFASARTAAFSCKVDGSALPFAPQCCASVLDGCAHSAMACAVGSFACLCYIRILVPWWLPCRSAAVMRSLPLPLPALPKGLRRKPTRMPLALRLQVQSLWD